MSQSPQSQPLRNQPMRDQPLRNQPLRNQPLRNQPLRDRHLMRHPHLVDDDAELLQEKKERLSNEYSPGITETHHY